MTKQCNAVHVSTCLSNNIHHLSSTAYLSTCLSVITGRNLDGATTVCKQSLPLPMVGAEFFSFFQPFDSWHRNNPVLIWYQVLFQPYCKAGRGGARRRYPSEPCTIGIFETSLMPNIGSEHREDYRSRKLKLQHAQKSNFSGRVFVRELLPKVLPQAWTQRQVPPSW